jgi:hypothetical protein
MGNTEFCSKFIESFRVRVQEIRVITEILELVSQVQITDRTHRPIFTAEVHRLIEVQSRLETSWTGILDPDSPGLGVHTDVRRNYQEFTRFRTGITNRV